MTANQVALSKVVEETRDNMFNEQELRRHNLASEGISQGVLNEDTRHNMQNESISWFNAQEQKRHNLEGENIGYGNLNLGYSQLGETQRHNQATENLGIFTLRETKRHNLRDEGISNTRNALESNAQSIRNRELVETQRHNKANESNTSIRNRNDYALGVWNNANNTLSGIIGTGLKVASLFG